MNGPHRRSIAFAVIMTAALATALSGCGRRGSLEPPPGANEQRDPSTPLVKNPEGKKVPDRDFILDPLL